MDGMRCLLHSNLSNPVTHMILSCCRIPLRSARFLAAALAFLGLTSLGAQTTPTDDSDVVVLAGFEVVTQRGDYRNTQAVTASRIAAEVRETPLSISVISEEFLRDTGVQEFQDAFRYTPGVSVDPDNQGQAIPGIRIRGLTTGYILRNGFIKWYHQNLDGVDRVELVRGPVSAFYGKAEPGGVINYQTKRPQFQWQHSLKAQYGRDDFKKVWLDTTGPLYKDQVAFRIVTTKTDSKHWKDYVEDDRLYFLGGITYRPTSRITINLDYEYDKRKGKGGRNTALIANLDYLADYGFYQDFAARNNWDKVLTTNNVTADPSSFVRYNFVHGESRYPMAYSVNDFPGTGNQQWQNYGRFLENFSSNPTGKTVRDFGNSWEAYARYLEGLSWMTVGAPDPRTGLPQQPIIAKGSRVGEMVDGRWRDTGFRTPVEMRNFRHGWQSLKFFESLGAYDPQTGQFINIESQLDRSRPETLPLGTIYPGNTGNHFPLGYAFNPNGANSKGFDENHIASADVTMRLADWISVRVASNYYENTTHRFQTYNSDTRMDGYSLNAVQGLAGFTGELGVPSDPRVANTMQAHPAQGMEHYNRRYTHQMDVNMEFDFAGARHGLLFLAEYRDEYYMQRMFITNAYANEVGVVNTSGRFARSAQIPGLTMWDIYNDPQPLIGQFFEPNAILTQGPGGMANTSNARVEHGFSASYRGRYLSDTLHLWTGIRHEREDTWGGLYLDKSRGPKAGGANFTSPMVGVSYQLFRGFNVFASYSESYLAAAVGQRNSPYRNPDNLGDPTDLISVRDPVPIKGTGYEAGVKFEILDKKLIGSAVVFSLDRIGQVGSDSALVENINRAYSIWQEQTGETIAPVVGIYTNQDSKRIEGFEVEFIYTPITNFQLVTSFSYYWTRKYYDISFTSLYGNTTSPTGGFPHISRYVWDDIYGGYRPKTESEKDGTEIYPELRGTELEGVPEMTFRVWGKYNFTEGRLKGFSAGGGISHESKSPAFATLDRPWFNPATYLVDAYLGYKFDLGPGRASVSLNVKNLLNKKYTKTSFGIIDPINYQLTFEYSF